MKAILEFDLNDPDEAQAHYRCVMANDMAIALWDLRQITRRAEKEEPDDYFEWFTREINEIFEDADFNLNSLTS